MVPGAVRAGSGVLVAEAVDMDPGGRGVGALFMSPARRLGRQGRAPLAREALGGQQV